MKKILEQIRLFFRRLKYFFRPPAKKIVIEPKTTTFTATMPEPKEEKENPASTFMRERIAKKKWTPKRAQRAWLRTQGRHPLHKDHFGTYSPVPRLVGDRHK